jgi:hypothetical protein
MSGKVTVWAWAQAERMPSSTVLVVMLAMADIARPSGKLWASAQYIARKAKLTDRTVRSAQAALKDMGIIEIRERDGRTNDIQFLLTPITIYGDGDEDRHDELEAGRRGRPKTPERHAATPERRSAEPKKEPEEEPSSLRSESSVDPDLLDDGYGDDEEESEEPEKVNGHVVVLDDDRPPFEMFWAAYPRKTAKGNARTAFDNAVKKQPASKRGPFAAMLVERAADFRDAVSGWPEAERVRFTPHAATWLNQGRWEDDMDDVRRSRGTGSGTDGGLGAKGRALRNLHDAHLEAGDR